MRGVRVGYRGLMAVALMSGILVAAMPSASASMQPTWSLHSDVAYPEAIDQMSCAPGTTFCAATLSGTGAAVNNFSGVLMFYGSGWSAPMPLGSGLGPISCPTSNFCAAIDNEGNAFTYSGGNWSGPISVLSVSSSNYVDGVSCPTATFCVATTIGYPGYSEADYFNGTSWSGPQSTGVYGIQSPSCGTPTFCMAGSQGGVAVYDGTSWTVQPSSISGQGLSCVSAVFCMGQTTSGYATYDGTTWSSFPWPSGISADSPLLLSCTTASLCLGQVNLGSSNTPLFALITYDGTSWSDPVYELPPDVAFGSFNSGGSCTTPTFCVVPNGGITGFVTYSNVPALKLTPSSLPVSPGAVTYGVSASGAGPTPTGSVTISDNEGGSCQIPSLTNGSGNCSITEDAAAGPYNVVAEYSGDANYGPTGSGINVVGAIARNGSAELGQDGITVTATGGNNGTDVLTETQYGGDEPTAFIGHVFGPGGGGLSDDYFDVRVSSGNTFSSVVVEDCNALSIAFGSPEWWDPSVNGGAGDYEPMIGDPGPVLSAPSANPLPCSTTTLDTNSFPDLAQLTGTVITSSPRSPAGSLSIVTSSLNPATVNQTYSESLTATGGNPPYKWKKIGKLPRGLKLNAKTGVISGVPSVRDSGTYTFEVQVTDTKIKVRVRPHVTIQDVATQNVSITVLGQSIRRRH